jgi:hypothetical protein
MHWRRSWIKKTVVEHPSQGPIGSTCIRLSIPSTRIALLFIFAHPLAVRMSGLLLLVTGAVRVKVRYPQMAYHRADNDGIPSWARPSTLAASAANRANLTA